MNCRGSMLKNIVLAIPLFLAIILIHLALGIMIIFVQPIYLIYLSLKGEPVLDYDFAGMLDTLFKDKKLRYKKSAEKETVITYNFSDIYKALFNKKGGQKWI